MGWLTLGSPLGSTLHIQTTKIHVFITTFRASRLCLILTTAKCLVPGGGAQITLYPSGTAYWLLIKGSVKAH